MSHTREKSDSYVCEIQHAYTTILERQMCLVLVDSVELDLLAAHPLKSAAGDQHSVEERIRVILLEEGVGERGG